MSVMIDTQQVKKGWVGKLLAISCKPQARCAKGLNQNRRQKLPTKGDGINLRLIINRLKSCWLVASS